MTGILKIAQRTSAKPERTVHCRKSLGMFSVRGAWKTPGRLPISLVATFRYKMKVKVFPQRLRAFCMSAVGQSCMIRTIGSKYAFQSFAKTVAASSGLPVRARFLTGFRGMCTRVSEREICPAACACTGSAGPEHKAPFAEAAHSLPCRPHSDSPPGRRAPAERFSLRSAALSGREEDASHQRIHRALSQ